MSRRTCRTMRTPKYEHPALAARGWRVTSDPSHLTQWSIPLILHRAGGQPEGDPALDEQEEDDDGNRRRASTPAMSAPQSVCRLVPRKYESQTVTVCLPWSFSRMRAKMYSFQLVMNAKTDVATSPGATSGSRIRTNAPSRVDAVDHRRLLEILRDAEDEAAQRPDRRTAART